MIHKPNFTFNHFLGMEQQRTFSTLFNLGKIGWLIPRFEQAYDLLDAGLARTKPQMLVYYSRYYFYHSIASFLRGHYSSAYANLRNALDAAYHHYNIYRGAYTIEEFVAGRGSYKDAKRVANELAKRRGENKRGTRELIVRLSGHHRFASRYGSHADPMSFEHRLQRDDKTGQWTFMFVQNKKANEIREDCVKLMNAFVDVLELHAQINHQPSTLRDGLLGLQLATLRTDLTNLSKNDQVEQ
jgi:hypothetical protein